MSQNLYENIGGKIKNWSKWIFIIEAISAIIGGIVLMANDAAFIGFIRISCFYIRISISN